MRRVKRFECKNTACPNFRENRIVEITDGDVFQCPYKAANCTADYLEELKPSRQRWWLWIGVLAIALLLVSVIGFRLAHKSGMPAYKAGDNDLVIVIDGGWLGSMASQIPSWISAAIKNSSIEHPLMIGLWECRPQDGSGRPQTKIAEFTGTNLVDLPSFRRLNISPPGAVDPSQEMEIGYDLFSGLKRVITETRWTVPTNRNLILITASSGLTKTDANNETHLDQIEIKKLADQFNVVIFALQVKLPGVDPSASSTNEIALYSKTLERDEALTKSQLLALTGEMNYYQVVARREGNPGIGTLESSESNMKSILTELLRRITEPNRGH